eukprot:TRINITY_DN61047_c0_g1_i1.p4 TRINITY_DN61047_c0_g1~~TRINITY_DN61047_c0_g1_i1.p4  ORF type:complete len:102 (-),score=0.64 TRINITY_DN61047_c0_g1_i1:341-646(-)
MNFLFYNQLIQKLTTDKCSEKLCLATAGRTSIVNFNPFYYSLFMEYMAGMTFQKTYSVPGLIFSQAYGALFCLNNFCIIMVGIVRELMGDFCSGNFGNANL